MTSLCPTHHTPLLTRAYCPRCIGAKGGQVKSEAKREASRKNARQPRPRARKEMKP